MRPVQKFSKEYLEQTRKMSPEAILRFLEDFQILHGTPSKSKTTLISLKVPEDLLRAFRNKAEIHQVKYQTQIKNLMEKWAKE